MFCTNCGKEIADGSAFCTNCGASLTENSIPETPAEETVKEFVAPEATVEETPAPETAVEEVPASEVVTNDISKASTQSMPLTKILGIASIALGVLSIIVSCCIPFISIPLSLIGVAAGGFGFFKSKKEGEKNTLALVGAIVSLLSFVGSVLYSVITLIIAIANNM